MPIRERTTANLHVFPAIRENHDTHVSVGDLHGNALKLIYILIEEGFLKLNKEQYDILHDIYLKSAVDRKKSRYTNAIIQETCSLTKQDIETFEKIISNAQVDSSRALTLIGDELADRGNNDYFTLFVLQKLKESHCNVDIILSNHSMAFMAASTAYQFDGEELITPTTSLDNMKFFLKQGLIKEEAIRTIVANSYLPMIKAINYTVSLDGQITLFSHAPIGLETIEALANKFKIPYKEGTSLELLQTIDAINQAVSNNFQNISYEFINDGAHKSNKVVPVPTSNPIKRLVWNRAFNDSDQPKTITSTGIKVKFVHGHVGQDGTIKTARSHTNLDNFFGMCLPDFNIATPPPSQDGKESVGAEHFTLGSDDITAQELQPFIAANMQIHDAIVQIQQLRSMQKQADAQPKKESTVVADATQDNAKTSEESQVVTDLNNTNNSVKALLSTMQEQVQQINAARTKPAQNILDLVNQNMALLESVATTPNQQLEPNLKKQNQVITLMAGCYAHIQMLKNIAIKLEQLSLSDSAYNHVSNIIRDQTTKLENAANVFFYVYYSAQASNSPSINTALKSFNQEILSVQQKILEETSMHKGWYSVPVLFRGIIGAISFMVVIPFAIVALATKDGAICRFFKTPKLKVSEVQTATTEFTEVQKIADAFSESDNANGSTMNDGEHTKSDHQSPKI